MQLGLRISLGPDAVNLVTPRLRLEPIEPRHAGALFEGLQSEHLYEFIAASPPASVDALRERYERLALRRSPDGTERWLNWAIFCLPEQRYIGYVQATVPTSGEASVAYVVFADSWGGGLVWPPSKTGLSCPGLHRRGTGRAGRGATASRGHRRAAGRQPARMAGYDAA